MTQRKSIRLRDRVETDDIDAVIGQCTGAEVGGAIVIPKRRTQPLSLWMHAPPTDDPKPVVIPDPERKRDTSRDESIRRLLNWPTSTSAACHNCAHTFDGIPVPLPVRYDENRRIYFCRGNFCSWQCAKRHNMDTGDKHRSLRNMYIANLAFATWIKLCGPVGDTKFDRMQRYLNAGGIQPAPAKETLILFGGNLDIATYRKGSFSVKCPDDTDPDLATKYIRGQGWCLLPFAKEEEAKASGASRPMVFTETKRCDVVSKVGMGSWKEALSRILANDKPAAASQGTTGMQLSRKRPLRTKDTLVTSMGIRISKKAKPDT